ncbi:MAG TPA: tetratricopeptide repeat protein [Polyangiaceae bacterium]|nr:tetratricopeptide repeat protein [Polyangiaceae bacterium]
MIEKCAILLVCLAFGSGCAASAGESIRADAEVVRRESTPDVLLHRGEGFAAVGDSTRAEQYYAAALAAGGDPRLLVRRLIRVCVSGQRYHAALAYADDYLLRCPTDHEVRFARATIAVGVGDTEQAHTDLLELAEAVPNNPDVHFALAVLLRDDFADLLEAREHFARYLVLAPNGANAAQARVAVGAER